MGTVAYEVFQPLAWMAQRRQSNAADKCWSQQHRLQLCCRQEPWADQKLPTVSQT